MLIDLTEREVDLLRRLCDEAGTEPEDEWDSDSEAVLRYRYRALLRDLSWKLLHEGLARAAP